MPSREPGPSVPRVAPWLRLTPSAARMPDSSVPYDSHMFCFHAGRLKPFSALQSRQHRSADSANQSNNNVTLSWSRMMSAIGMLAVQ